MNISSTQYEMLVKFMEEHGDLNNPYKYPKNKVQLIQKWETLTNNLNNDNSGEVKRTEKWKKIWSTLKNNTKQKVARINKAALVSGGRPTLKLYDLEQRVLNIMALHAASQPTSVAGKAVSQIPPEQTLEQASDKSETADEQSSDNALEESEKSNSSVEPDPFRDEDGEYGSDDNYNPDEDEESLSDVTHCSGVSESQKFSEDPNIITVTSTSSVPQPSAEMVIEDSPVINTIDNIHNLPRTSQQPLKPPDRPDISSPTLPELPYAATPEQAAGRSSQRGPVPRRRRLPRPFKSHVKQARIHFLRSDEQWRMFLMQKHANKYRRDRDRLQLREKELQIQEKWQEVAMHAVDALHKIIDSKLYKH